MSENTRLDRMAVMPTFSFWSSFIVGHPPGSAHDIHLHYSEVMGFEHHPGDDGAAPRIRVVTRAYGGLDLEGDITSFRKAYLEARRWDTARLVGSQRFRQAMTHTHATYGSREVVMVWNNSGATLAAEHAVSWDASTGMKAAVSAASDKRGTVAFDRGRG